MGQKDSKKKREGLTNNAINKILGKKWQMLDSSDRQKYETMAYNDKVRYLREVSVYNGSNPSDPIIPRINGPEVAVKSAGGAGNRPLNAYSYYSRQERLYVKDLHACIPVELQHHKGLQHVMGKRLASRWKNMSPEERTIYEELEKHCPGAYEKILLLHFNTQN